jgi:hypothetical protein
MDEEIIDYIASLAVEKIFDSGDTIVRQGDKTDGMYLIITGLVKVCSYRMISICRKPALHLLDSSTRFFFLEVRYKSHPLVSLGSRYACVPPPPPPPLHFTNIFKTCFYQSKLTVLMGEMLFNHFQKVLESLEWFGALFDFLKISCGHPMEND